MHPLLVAATKLPWKTIITTGLSVADTSRRIYDSVKKNREDEVLPATLESLNSRLEALERNEISQAELVSEMAGQILTLSDSLKVLAVRLTIALLVAALAVAVAVAALFIG